MTRISPTGASPRPVKGGARAVRSWWHSRRAASAIVVLGLGMAATGLTVAPASAASIKAPRSVNQDSERAKLHVATARGNAHVSTFSPRSPTTLTVGSCQPPGPFNFATIQGAINNANPGDTVSVCPGTYTENVTVNQSVTIVGSGLGSTTVEPAVSNPNCGGAGGGSLCAGGSNVFLIQASNVTIQNLTVDGHNPSLTSGVVAGGVDLDARNGIIEDFNAGIFNNTVVQGVAVQNIYLRGIYASSGGTGFDFDHDTVANVQADPSSIAMFNFGGSGTMSNNVVSYANDALSSNWSAGTTFVNNAVSHSGSGVHTDNSNGFGITQADVISGNVISACATDGYGVYDFVPYLAPTISNNTVTGCAVGLGSFGSGGPGVNTAFSGNSVDGTGATVSKGSTLGAYISTTEFGFGDSDVTATLTSNTITNFSGDGAYIEQTGSGPNPHATLQFNRIALNGAGLANASNQTVSAADNWWGCSAGPSAAACNPVTGAGTTTSTPWLVLGIGALPSHTYDTSLITADLTHDNLGADTSGSGHLPDGIIVGFATAVGSLDHATVPTSSGQASAVLSANGQHGAATVTVSLDHDAPTVNVYLIRPSLTITDAALADGLSGTTPMTFTVRLNHAVSTPVTVNYNTVDGTATSSGSGFANPDYDAASGMLTFSPGVTSQPIAVMIHGYPYNEAKETFTVVLSSPSANAVILPGAGVGVGYITNDDARPKVKVTKAVSVAAGDAATFHVRLSAPSDQVVTVQFSTADGTALASGDYTATSGTLTFPVGVSTLPVSVATIVDGQPDSSETFFLKISSPTNASLGTSVKGTATIGAH